MGFWGINYTDMVAFKGIAESEDSGTESLQQYKSCPNFSDGDTEKNKAKFQDVFIPHIRKRLNKFVKGYKFTDDDVYNLYLICAYEDAVAGAESSLYQT
jgi:hypothetical protein